MFPMPDGPFGGVHPKSWNLGTVDENDDDVEDSADVSAYNASEILGNRSKEVERLRVQITLSFEKELHHLRSYGLSDGSSLLELGCGPGWSTLHFAMALPRAQITCIEIDRGFVGHAQQLLADYAPRVAIRHGSALATRLTAATFDFVTCRFVLQHLQKPSTVIKEALRLLKPGGRLGVVETDDMIGGVMDPILPALQPLNMRFSLKQAAKGGSRTIGRHLFRLMREAGFTQQRLESALAASDEHPDGVKAFSAHFDVDRFESLIHDGVATANEVEQARISMHAFLNDPTSIAIMVNLVAMGRKPVDPVAPRLAAPAPRHTA